MLHIPAVIPAVIPSAFSAVFRPVSGLARNVGRCLRKGVVASGSTAVVLVFGAVLVGAVPSTVAAQQIDNTLTLPDAKPGECYAKVIVPPKFADRSEEVVTQEAAERIESTPALFETVEERVVVRESSSNIVTTPAVFEAATERVEVRARELNWTVGEGSERRPANPTDLESIVASGIDLDSVKPGSCVLEHWQSPVYRSELQRVLTKAPSVQIEVNPAVYETVEERIVVKEASQRIVDMPAIYRTEQERVLIEPARSVWKPGRGPVERIDDTTGEIMCLVELPARYETVSRTVLDTPASSRIEQVPAEYKTYTVQRLVTPASERRVDVEAQYTNVETQRRISDATFFWLADGAKAAAGSNPTGEKVCLTETPAEYKSIPTQKLVEEASTQVIAVPAEYQTVPVQKLVSAASEARTVIPAVTETITRRIEIEPARLEWRPVLCETNMTPSIVTEIQQALEREGYDPGPADGVVGRATLNAIEAYQTDNDLNRGGITYQTLTHLRVEETS